MVTNGIAKPEKDPHSDRDRQLMLKGVRMEEQRWKKALRKAGLPCGVDDTPEKIMSIICWKMMVAKEYAWDTMKNLCIAHVQKCGDICSAQMLEELTKSEKEAPPHLDKDDEEGPRPEDLYEGF